MEYQCKIVLFGDSIIKCVAAPFRSVLKDNFPDHSTTVVNAGVSGETSREGLHRVKSIVAEKADVVVIGFGMNDWRKGVTAKEYESNIKKLIDRVQSVNTRVILSTITPAREGLRIGYNKEVDRYNAVLRSIASEKCLKIADSNGLWQIEIKPQWRGLRDAIHPNKKGNQVICQALMDVVPRKHTVVLWQYNGAHAKCNYRCPYCYYIGLHHPCDMSFGKMEEWHTAFKRAFGNQDLIFYLAFGEPTLGKKFPQVVEMVETEPNWQIRMTSNISTDFTSLVKMNIVHEGRLHINASFHPLAIDREEFLKTLQFLRQNGIEAPIVYVMYPPFIDRFEDDLRFFSRHNFVVHIRRFQGWFKGRRYPWAYTHEQKQKIARYCDDGTIKYMLNQQNNKGDLSYSGLHFFIVDNVGNVGFDSNVFQPYTKFRCIFGNVLQANFNPLRSPGIYPGLHEGTVDGVANLVRAGYHELVGNNVLSFAQQGGVYFDGQEVVYKNRHTDFTDSRTRAEYNFKPRDFKDAFFSGRKVFPRKAVQYSNLLKRGQYRTMAGKFYNECTGLLTLFK